VNSQVSEDFKIEKARAMPGSSRLLAVSEHKKSGLILCKAYHAEFAGPGAVVNAAVEQECTSIWAIGSPEIIEVVTPAERQKGYSRRIQWMRWLQKIADHSEPLVRAEKLLSGFEAFFGGSVLRGLPDEVLARLVGVLPQTIATARIQHRRLGRINELEQNSAYDFASSAIVALDPKEFQALNKVPVPFTVSASFSNLVYKRPVPA
jgi:hypothetical protein